MILVTGATGFIGSRLLKRLATSAAPRLRGLSRSAGSAALPAGVEAVGADLTEATSLASALTGVSTVVHTAAITANLKEPYPGAYDRINRVGTGNLVAAAREAGVTRIVLLSGLLSGPVREGSYMATRVAMEDAVRQSGIPYLILQPSVLFGDGAEFVAALARLARVSPVLPLLGASSLRFQPLWIEDLLRCLEACLGSDAEMGREIPLGGAEQLSFREVLETICAAIGVRRLLLPLPLPLAAIQARGMAAALPHPPLTPATLELFGFDNSTDLDSVERNFGFRPRGFREHLLAHGVEA